MKSCMISACAPHAESFVISFSFYVHAVKMKTANNMYRIVSYNKVRIKCHATAEYPRLALSCRTGTRIWFGLQA
jgi:hypothetical protein